VIDDDAATGPLAGVLVADFSRILAGPYATLLLADLGATVIKVEGPPTGDDTRTWTPPVSGDGTATYFLSINRNKRSIVLDLADADDLDVAHRLAARADVVIENFKPGVLAQAVSGLMSVTGEPDGGPTKAGVALFDVTTGLHAAIAILAALHHRERTGEGQRVETNLLSAALSGLVNHTSAYLAADVVPRRMGNAHASLFPYEPLPTADGDLIIIAANDNQWRRLVGAIGAPELLADPRFGSMGERNTHRGALRVLLVARLATRPAQEWFDVLTAAGVPCGPINTVEQGIALADRLGLEPVVRPGGVPGVRNPVTYSATPPSYRRPPPALGADGDEIRAWLKD
jgi:crotonobetainyl-CoA:carnitine CoA-transferase CaiB-like acyl-CoA transferase